MLTHLVSTVTTRRSSQVFSLLRDSTHSQIGKLQVCSQSAGNTNVVFGPL